MSASAAPAFDAIAFQLAASLDRYALDCDALARRWPDKALYAAVSGQMDALRMTASALPDIAVQHVSLLIAHAALVHSLWKSQSSPVFDPGLLARAREDHHAAVGALRRRCLRLLAETATEDDGPSARHVG